MNKKKIIITVSFLLTVILAMSGVAIVATVAEEGTPEVRIAAQNLAFKDSVYLTYAVKAENVPAGAEKGLLLWLNPQTAYTYENAEIIMNDGVTREITLNGVEDTYDVYEYRGLAARQMTDTVYAVAYVKDDADVYYSTPMKYSVLQYVYNKTGKTGTRTAVANLPELLEQMLAYGAAAQTYTEYKTDRLATADWYQVLVVGGTLDDGFDYGLYLPGDEITLTAPAESDGKTFSYWKTSTGDVAGTTAVSTVTVGNANETYTAVYGEAVPTDGPVPSEGLEFDSNGDGTCYVISMGDCTDTDVVIPEVSPDGDTVVGIEASAFAGEAITSIHIPATVEEIGRRAFNGCTELTDVYFDGTEEEWAEVNISANNAPLENATMHFKSSPVEPEPVYTEPTIVVGTTTADAGEQNVTVTISLMNNPGISSMKFDVDYDETLTLKNVEFNSAFGAYVTAPTPYKNPQTITFISPLAEVDTSGVFATLTFDVSSAAAADKLAAIKLSVYPDDVYDMNFKAVVFDVVNGGVNVE